MISNVQSGVTPDDAAGKAFVAGKVGENVRAFAELFVQFRTRTVRPLAEVPRGDCQSAWVFAEGADYGLDEQLVNMMDTL